MYTNLFHFDDLQIVQIDFIICDDHINNLKLNK